MTSPAAERGPRRAPCAVRSAVPLGRPLAVCLLAAVSLPGPARAQADAQPPDVSQEADPQAPSAPAPDAPQPAPEAVPPADTEPPPSSADQLTDADFGVAGPNVAVAQPEPGGGGWLELGGGASLSSRRFDFESAPGMGAARPPRFRAGWNWNATARLDVHPFAVARRGFLADLGLFADYARSVRLAGDERDGRTRETRLHAGLDYRIRAGAGDTPPVFGLSAGYLRHAVEVVDDSVELPDVAYGALALGADVRVPLGTQRVALRAGARYIVVGSGGDLLTPEAYGDSRVAGLELGGSLEARPLSFLFLRIEGSYTRYSFEFNGNGMLSGPGAIGAHDQYVTGCLATGLSL